MDAPIPGGSAAKGFILMGSKGSRILGVVSKTANVLSAWKKSIRLGVPGHPDVLNKGFHVHFDEIANELELGLRPIVHGHIGFIQVGKLSVGTANQIDQAISLFNQAMGNPKFRAELLVRLQVTQQYLQTAFKGKSQAQLAIDKAHEINYLIKAVTKFK